MIIRRIFPDVQFYSREPRETRFSRVHEAKDKTIVVDLNHLLADKRLNFNVKVTDITAAEARYTPGSCIASKQKSPVWESQPGHNDRRSFVLTNRVRFFPMSLDSDGTLQTTFTVEQNPTFSILLTPVRARV